MRPPSGSSEALRGFRDELSMHLVPSGSHGTRCIHNTIKGRHGGLSLCVSMTQTRLLEPAIKIPQTQGWPPLCLSRASGRIQRKGLSRWGRAPRKTTMEMHCNLKPPDAFNASFYPNSVSVGTLFSRLKEREVTCSRSHSYKWHLRSDP